MSMYVFSIHEDTNTPERYKIKKTPTNLLRLLNNNEKLFRHLCRSDLFYGHVFFSLHFLISFINLKWDKRNSKASKKEQKNIQKENNKSATK